MVSKGIVYTSISIIVILNLIILVLSIYGSIMLHNSKTDSSGYISKAHSYMTWVAIISALSLILFIALTIFLIVKGGLTTEVLQSTVSSFLDKKTLTKKQITTLEDVETQTIKAKSSSLIFMIGAAVFLIIILITGILSGVAWYEIGKQSMPDNKAKIGYTCAIINTLVGFFLIILSIAIILMMYFINKYQETLISKADLKTHIRDSGTKNKKPKKPKDEDEDNSDDDSNDDSNNDDSSDSDQD